MIQKNHADLEFFFLEFWLLKKIFKKNRISTKGYFLNPINLKKKMSTKTQQIQINRIVRIFKVTDFLLQNFN